MPRNSAASTCMRRCCRAGAGRRRSTAPSWQAMARAERMPITDAVTASDLHDALARLGGDLMVRAIGALERGKLQLTKQSGQGGTYAGQIGKAEGRTHW